MTAFARIAMIAATGLGLSLGLPLSPAGAARAEPPNRPGPPSYLHRLVGADLGTLVHTLPHVLCGNRLISYRSPSPNSPVKCVNGAENSGNSVDSGNYHNVGDPVNSGNFSNANGSTATANSVDSGNASNGPQSISVPTPRMALPIAARPCHPGHRRCRGKGNSWNSGNYRAKGRQISSGNFGNANGSIDSNNTYGGGNNANGPLCVKCRWYGPS